MITAGHGKVCEKMQKRVWQGSGLDWTWRAYSMRGEPKSDRLDRIGLATLKTFGLDYLPQIHACLDGSRRCAKCSDTTAKILQRNPRHQVQQDL